MENSSRSAKSRRKKADRHLLIGDADVGGGVEDGDEECNAEAWQTLSKSFCEVQLVLDKNRSLIQQVDENHQSRIPDNLAQNVALIREINGNISKVRSLYSDLSVNFSTIAQQRRMKNGKIDSGSSNGME